MLTFAEREVQSQGRAAGAARNRCERARRGHEGVDGAGDRGHANISERLRILEEEIEALGPVRISQVEGRAEVVRAIATSESEGAVAIHQGR